MLLLGSIYLKIHNAHVTRMRYKRRKLGCQRRISKGTLPGTNYLFGCISVSIEGVFVKIRTSHTPRMRYKRCKCGSNGSIIKGTLPEYKVHFSLYLSFHWNDFPENSYFELPMRTVYTVQVCIHSVNN